MESRSKRQDGVAVLEFALVLPLLVVLVFGIIEFGLILFDKAVITNASREGARAGIIAQNPRVSVATITAVVNNYCATHLITFGGGSPAVSLPDGICTSGYGYNLKVRVAYHYDYLVLPNFVSGLVGGIDLTADTVMKCE